MSRDSHVSTLQQTLLRSAVYRSSRQLHAISFEGLSPEDQHQLATLETDERVHAFLTPRPGCRGRLHAVDHDTASLFQRLETAGRVPSELAVDPRIRARLVLDGILEIGQGGSFVSGPAATPLLFGSVPRWEPAGRLGRLTDAALDYGLGLHMENPLALAARLYRYHVEPLSPAWRRRLPDDDAIDAFLALGRFGATARLVDDAGGSAATDRPLWRHWRAHGAPDVGADRPTYKLYVSPRIEHLPQALAAVTRLLAVDHRPFAVKVGRTLFGLLRPDKLVLYFASRDSLDQAAADVARSLDGVPAQGVPFTAAITADGLLSWGMDPPAGESLVAWHYDASWRKWLVNKLAVALVVARAFPAEVAPVTFAKARVALEGVDPARWTPDPNVWAAPAGTGGA